MNIENTKAQMRKGLLELCILAIIAEREAYPSDIIQKLKESELIVVEGTLYPLLTRLKNDGLLDYHWQESNSGPPRKYFRITTSGITFLQELIESWNDLVRSVAVATQRFGGVAPMPSQTPAGMFDKPKEILF
jgi:PadR family transcriptional regulator PadR